ncbi:MAG: hypothetical protein ACOC1G_05615, partial [Phycisphaeraceae bacterium]
TLGLHLHLATRLCRVVWLRSLYAMIRGFHFIFSAYGFWLPNDPRGSWSDCIRQYELRAFGPATKTTTRRSVAGKEHDRRQRTRAKTALKRAPVRFTGLQAREVARGFAEACGEGGYVCYALAVLPDHAHLVIGRHSRPVRQLGAHLKAKATAALSRANMHPLAQETREGRTPSPWARGYWCMFLDTDERIRQCIEYVDANPPKAGLPPQQWKFVVPPVI